MKNLIALVAFAVGVVVGVNGAFWAIKAISEQSRQDTVSKYQDLVE